MNTLGVYWTNLLVDSSPAKLAFNAAKTWQEALRALEPEIEIAAERGFGWWGVFEPGPRIGRHEPSGWNRPLRQLTLMGSPQRIGLRKAIELAHKLGLKVDAYIGTLVELGMGLIVDAVPSVDNVIYMQELKLAQDFGFDRVTIDATGYNSLRENHQRPKGVGGGRRLDGMLALRKLFDIELGVEAWPREEGRPAPGVGPALITGQWASNLMRQGKLVPATAVRELEQYRIAVFNKHQDGADEESLARFAAAGHVFDAGDRTVVEYVAELNAVAHEARRTLMEPHNPIAKTHPTAIEIHEEGVVVVRGESRAGFNVSEYEGASPAGWLGLLLRRTLDAGIRLSLAEAELVGKAGDPKSLLGDLRLAPQVLAYVDLRRVFEHPAPRLCCKPRQVVAVSSLTPDWWGNLSLTDRGRQAMHTARPDSATHDACTQRLRHALIGNDRGSRSDGRARLRHRRGGLGRQRAPEDLYDPSDGPAASRRDEKKSIMRCSGRRDL